MNQLLNPSSREFFEDMYRASTDPWNFEKSAYELSRYDAIISALSSRRYSRGFEPGCSVGVLTARLAKFCDEVLATDISDTAVTRARERCNNLPNVCIEQGSVSGVQPLPLDLLILSEIGYYFTVSERALAVETALRRYAGPLNRCWIANTDADCELPTTWLTDQLKLAEQGTHSVAGIVSADTFEEHPSHVARRFPETYVLHSDGTHPHVHGANFGVRADVYQMAGGWSGLTTAEDHDLWNRLQSQGHLCRSIAALEITTSGHIQGRAPEGFAGALAAHGVIP